MEGRQEQRWEDKLKGCQVGHVRNDGGLDQGSIGGVDLIPEAQRVVHEESGEKEGVGKRDGERETHTPTHRDRQEKEKERNGDTERRHSEDG